MKHWLSRILLAWVTILALGSVPTAADAQFLNFGRVCSGGGGGSRPNPRELTGLPPWRYGFSFCRLMFNYVRQDCSGTGWRIEYPRADQNFMTRLAQLTTTQISEWGDQEIFRGLPWPNYPGHVVVEATSPELYQCPFVMMSSPGTVGFSDAEAEALRDYLLKGGFLWGDDFWGYGSWDHWVAEIGRILPEYPIVQLQPGDPLFSTFYTIQEVPQIPSLNSFRRLGGDTSELGEESRIPSMHAIFDAKGRPMVLMTHNTDIADGWEREADLDAFFQRFAWQSYAVGLNVMMWIMTR